MQPKSKRPADFAFGNPDRRSVSIRACAFGAGERKAVYESTVRTSTRVRMTEEIDDAKDRAVNEILARRRQRA